MVGKAGGSGGKGAMEQMRAGAFRGAAAVPVNGEVAGGGGWRGGAGGEGDGGGGGPVPVARLYEHRVGQFREGLRVGNVVGRLVAGQESGRRIWRGRRLSSCVATWWSFGSVCERFACFYQVCLLIIHTRCHRVYH